MEFKSCFTKLKFLRHDVATPGVRRCHFQGPLFPLDVLYVFISWNIDLQLEVYVPIRFVFLLVKRDSSHLKNVRRYLFVFKVFVLFSHNLTFWLVISQSFQEEKSNHFAALIPNHLSACTCNWFYHHTFVSTFFFKKTHLSPFSQQFLSPVPRRCFLGQTLPVIQCDHVLFSNLRWVQDNIVKK